MGKLIHALQKEISVLSDCRCISHPDYCEKPIKETKLGYFYAWKMYEWEENNISSITEFKIFVDLVSGEVRGNVSTAFSGTWSGPLEMKELRVRLIAELVRATFQARLCCASLAQNNWNYKFGNTCKKFHFMCWSS